MKLPLVVFILASLRRILLVTTCCTVFLLFWFALTSVQHATRQIEQFVVSNTRSIAESASFSDDLISIQKDIKRFSEAFQANLDFDSKLEVFLDNKLIASSGNVNGIQGFSSAVFERIVLPSNQVLLVKVEINYSRQVVQILIFLVYFLSIYILLYFYLKALLKKTLLKITSPLSKMVSWIKNCSAQLPQSLDSIMPSDNGDSLEVKELGESVVLLVNEIKKLQNSLEVENKNKGRIEIAAQVAHDIRSPLAALSMVENDLGVLAEETRVMLRSAIGRIRDIANHLLDRSISIENASMTEDEKHLNNDVDVHLVSALIEGILTEKRMQYRSNIGIEIDGHLDASSYGLFAKVQASEFKRILSNVVNNSVEAMREKCVIAVSLETTFKNEIRIKIQDNGKGIRSDILSKLGTRGETHGKAAGSGLGLYHARKCLDAWGGKLELDSKFNFGTTVNIILPRSEAPSWFVEELRLIPNSNVVILDDDESIQRIWRVRADSAKLNIFGINLLHLSTPSELRTWKNETAQEGFETTYLIDYELIGFSESGLDLIEELGIAPQSILVTSRYEELSIRERCQKLKISLVPKGMAGFVPIQLIEKADEANKLPTAVLIDDDNLVHMTWKMAATEKGLVLLSFKTVEDFLQSERTLARSIPIYIDSLLGKDKKGREIRGEMVAQHIFERGFKLIFLTTGLSHRSFEHSPWLSGVRGKEPPF